VTADRYPTAELIAADQELAELAEEVQKKDHRRRQRRVAVRRWILVTAVAIGMALGAYDIWITAQSGRQLDEIQSLTNKSIAVSNNHHASSVQKDDEIQKAVDIANGALAEISANQKTNEGVLAQVKALQSDLDSLVPQATSEIKAGQAQINAYLVYLSCLGTHPGNVAVCGATPPLPPTS
jgi:hypothetical protein